MCFLLFLEPSRCTPHEWGSQFSQPSCHFSPSCVSNLSKPQTIILQSYYNPAFLSLFFGFPFFVPSISKCSAFTGPLSSFILFTCSDHHNLSSLRNYSNLSTPVIARIFSLFILSSEVVSHITRNILISVVFNFLSSFTFNVQHSAPQIMHKPLHLKSTASATLQREAKFSNHFVISLLVDNNGIRIFVHKRM